MADDMSHPAFFESVGEGRPLAPIRQVSDGHPPPQTAAGAAELSQPTNAAAPLLLRSQVGCKAYRSRSVGTQGEGSSPHIHSSPALTKTPARRSLCDNHHTFSGSVYMLQCHLRPILV